MPTITLGAARKNFMAAQEARRRRIKKGCSAAGAAVAPADAGAAAARGDVSSSPAAASKGEVCSSPATRRSSSAPAERKKKGKPARKKFQVELAKSVAAAEVRSRQKLTAFREALANQGQHYRRPERRLGRAMPVAVMNALLRTPEPMGSAVEVFAAMRKCSDANFWRAYKPPAHIASSCPIESLMAEPDSRWRLASIRVDAEAHFMAQESYKNASTQSSSKLMSGSITIRQAIETCGDGSANPPLVTASPIRSPAPAFRRPPPPPTDTPMLALAATPTSTSLPFSIPRRAPSPPHLW